MIRGIIDWIKKVLSLIQRSRKVRRASTGILMAGLALGIGALIINTVGHLTMKETPVDKDATIPVKVIADSFTLKVAAYLKPEYAR